MFITFLFICIKYYYIYESRLKILLKKIDVMIQNSFRLFSLIFHVINEVTLSFICCRYK